MVSALSGTGLMKNPRMHIVNKKPARPKILVVDDDPDMRIFFSTLLKAGGYKPIVARDGKEGLMKAGKEIPAVIILAVPMLENGGMQMYMDLKADPKFRWIPVFMISTIDRQTFIHYQKTKSIRLGQDVVSPEAFLEKPPETAEFLGLIQDMVSRRIQNK